MAEKQQRSSRDVHLRCGPNARVVLNTLNPQNNDHAREEIHPNSVSLLAISFDNFVFVRDPAVVPKEESDGIVDPEDVDVLDLEPGVLGLSYDPREGTRSVGPREDPTVHVKTPVCGGENESVSTYERIRLFQSRRTKGDPRTAIWGRNLRPGARKSHCRTKGQGTGVRGVGYREEMSRLSHLQTDNLGELPFLPRQIAIITTLDASPSRISTVLPDSSIPKSSLVVAEGDTQNIALVILVSERCKGLPSASNIKKTVIGL